MKIEQSGTRVNTLERTMELVAKVYTRATPIGNGKKGITAVKSLNGSHDYDGVTPGKIKNFIKCLTFEGPTPIGTILYQKILKGYVHKDMTRPLLIIIITDGEVRSKLA